MASGQTLFTGGNLATGNPNLRAIVVIGRSNAIRFSISDVSINSARILPIVFQAEVSISVYHADYHSGNQDPIPESTIEITVDALLQFKRTCQDFGVPDNNIRVVGAEALRGAPDSAAVRDEIKARSGWEVELLSKENETFIRGLGVANSLAEPWGLIMHLGCESLGLTFVHAWKTDPQRPSCGGDVILDGITSLPYGMETLAKRMNSASRTADGLDLLSQELKKSFRRTLKDMHKATDTLWVQETIPLYLTGGALCRWGQMVVNRSAIKPYPIPIINGFAILTEELGDISSYLGSNTANNEDVFRISAGTAARAPTVTFLIQSLLRGMPCINQITFSQGGIREGLLYQNIDDLTRGKTPFRVATQSFAPRSVAAISSLILAAAPRLENPRPWADILIPPFANLLFAHGSHAKDGHPVAALHLTTPGGVLGDDLFHGHDERAALALMLCSRWGGELPPTEMNFAKRLRKVAHWENAFWAEYIGLIGALVAAVYPAGIVEDIRLKLCARLKAEGDFCLEVGLASGREARLFAKPIERIARFGEGNWIGGEKGASPKFTVSTYLFQA